MTTRIAIPGDDPPQLQGSPHLDRLRARGEVVMHTNRPADDDEKLRRVAGAVCLINSRSAVKWPGPLLRQLPSLRMLTVCGIGTDSIDLATAKELGIAVCNVPGLTAPIVAEHALALMLATARRVCFQTQQLRKGIWKTPDNLYLRGRTLGILGVGPIGAATARLGQAIGMRVQAWTFNPSADRARELGFPFVELDELLRTSDVVSIHVKLTDQTRGLIGARELALMKPGSLLVNTARGAVVVTAALVDALNRGHLGGAGIDVYDVEPIPPDYPLLACEQVVLTPHVADQNPEGMEILNRGAVDNVLAFLDGKPINRVVQVSAAKQYNPPMHWLVASLTIVAAYLIGAIPFGYLVARWRGVDIFEHGSKNIGATNVGSVLGHRFGMLVFALDFAKGAGPVALALVLKTYFDDELWSRGFVEVGAGLFAFLGHMFPIYLRFRGGKGVATGAGAVAVLVPIPWLVGLFVWLVVACASRYVSLASILAVVGLCAAHLRQPEVWDWGNPRTWFLLGGGALVIIKHHANIRRLLNGTESQLKETSVMHQVSKSLHVLALGLWFGTSVFFTFVVALSLFTTFETLGQKKERETWFPQPALYADAKDFDAPKEQGIRAAGYAVGPMFLWYFALQGVCGFIALATALPWLKFANESWMHRWRVSFLIVALACVVVGWPIEQHVSGLRDPRNQATEAYLADRGNETKLSEMKAARAAFGQWHLLSLALNFATIILVTGAMALAGNLPPRSATTISEPEAQAKI